MSMDLNEPMPDWLNLESVKKLSEVEKITSLSAESLRRRFPQYIIKLTERRDGMKLKHALAIANGAARQG